MFHENCSISDFQKKIAEEYEFIMKMLNDAIDNDNCHSKIDYGFKLNTFVINYMYLKKNLFFKN